MRIAVVGTSGAGKTTLGKQLAGALKAPFIELDAINWQPNWRDLITDDRDEFIRRVDQATSGEHWVSDGNYHTVRHIVWARATHLVWLDYRRSVIMARVIGRSFVRAWDQRELWGGNRERWTSWFQPDHPIRWAWSTWKERRVEFETCLKESAYAHLKVLRLSHPREAPGITARLAQYLPLVGRSDGEAVRVGGEVQR
jgi:adenylate kinase family enzyme